MRHIEILRGSTEVYVRESTVERRWRLEKATCIPPDESLHTCKYRRIAKAGTLVARNTVGSICTMYTPIVAV